MSIFRMAERLSGRWPDSQGVCGVRRSDEPQVFSSIIVNLMDWHRASFGGLVTAAASYRTELKRVQAFAVKAATRSGSRAPQAFDSSARKPAPSSPA